MTTKTKLPDTEFVLHTLDGKAQIHSQPGYTAEHMEAYAKAERDRVIEECAKVCDELSLRLEDDDKGLKPEHMRTASAAACDCAEAIREMGK